MRKSQLHSQMYKLNINNDNYQVELVGGIYRAVKMIRARIFELKQIFRAFLRIHTLWRSEGITRILEEYWETGKISIVWLKDISWNKAAEKWPKNHH